MTSKLETDWLPCWCYATKRMVKIRGVIKGKRQADLLDVTDCDVQDCSLRNDVLCLIGKIREGRWK